MRRISAIIVQVACALTAVPVLAQDADSGRIRAAVERAVPQVQESLKTFNAKKSMPPIEAMPALPATYRKAGCTSCHHEGLGLTTLSFLQKKGFEIDAGVASQQADALRRAYAEFGPLYKRALTDEKAAKEADFFEDIAVQMGYMLGGLLDSGHKPDAITDAAARLLMKFQEEDGYWTYTTAREPMQSSDFATTAMAARVLLGYAPKDQAGQVDQAITRARIWLRDHAPESTDDMAFRLLGLRWLGASTDEISEAVKPLMTAQREDGGWGQHSSSRKSDGYATGLALVALHQGGGVSVDDPVYRRGVAFLLEAQKPDGTWYVQKWAHGYNNYFDAGFPYGKSQFVSLAGTCYAIMALAQTVPGP